MPDLYLLDAHTLLWFIDGNQKLSRQHDRQIVATALVAQRTGAQVTILTKDRNISQSGLVPTLW